MIDQNYKSELFYHQCQKRLNSILDLPQKMYHYTSVEVLKSIIENKCIYATHINFMNDWEEYTLGYRILTNKLRETIEEHQDEFEKKIGVDNLKEIKQYFSGDCPDVTTYSDIYQRKKFGEYRACMLPEVFTISFCQEKDLLSQWAIYAKESGVAIEFDFSDFVFIDASLDEKDKKNYREDEWQEIKYYRYNRPHIMDYSREKMEGKLQEQIIEVIRHIKDPEFGKYEKMVRPVDLIKEMAELYTIVPFCKLDKFKAENEIRLAFMRLEHWIEGKGEEAGYFFKTKIFYRAAGHVLKPFLKIGWEATKPDTYPVKKIIVGPGRNQEVVFRGLIHFIENQEASVIPNRSEPFSSSMINESYKTCKGIIIQKSNIPYIF